MCVFCVFVFSETSSLGYKDQWNPFKVETVIVKSFSLRLWLWGVNGFGSSRLQDEDWTVSQWKVLAGTVLQTCVFTLIPQCWKSLNFWTLRLTSAPEARSPNTNTAALNTPRAPCRCECVCLYHIYSPLHSLYQHDPCSALLFHLHHAVLGAELQIWNVFFMSFPVSFLVHTPGPLSLSARLLTHTLTHPLSMLAYKHRFLESKTTRANMTGIWKCLISLGGWVSNPPANGRGRRSERERERDTVQEHCVHFAGARWWGQLWCGTASLPVRPWHTHTQTDTITSACLYRAGLLYSAAWASKTY